LTSFAEHRPDYPFFNILSEKALLFWRGGIRSVGSLYQKTASGVKILAYFENSRVHGSEHAADAVVRYDSRGAAKKYIKKEKTT